MGSGINTEKIVEEAEYLDRIFSKLEYSYYTDTIDGHIFEKNNPTQEGVGKIIDDLFKVIFPEFISNNKPVTKKLLKKYICPILGDLRKELEDQLFRAYVNAYSTLDNICVINKVTFEYKEIAQKISLLVLDNIPKFRCNLFCDIEAAYRGDPAAFSYDEIILSYPFIQAMTVHNIAHFLYKNKVPLIPRMMSEWVHTKTGIDIHPGAQIGKSFFIDHGTGVVIGETAQIGNNVKLYQGVTIGAFSFEKNENGEPVNKTFYEKVENGQITKKKLNSKTIDAFNKVFDWIETNLNL